MCVSFLIDFIAHVYITQCLNIPMETIIVKYCIPCVKAGIVGCIVTIIIAIAPHGGEIPDVEVIGQIQEVYSGGVRWRNADD